MGGFLVTNCLKKERKLFKKEKSCTKSEKLLEGLKVAPNLKSCSKVAEQLMDNPSPGSIPGPGVICTLSLLLVFVFARGVFSGFSGFPPSTKTNTPNSNSIANPWPHKLLALDTTVHKQK